MRIFEVDVWRGISSQFLSNSWLCFNLYLKLLEKHIHTHKELTNVEVGGRPHLSVFGNDINDQWVANQSDQHDEAEEEGDQPGVCEEGVLSPFLIFVTLPVSPQRQVHFRSIHPKMFSGVPGLLRRVHGDGAIVAEVREVGEEDVKVAEKLMSAWASGGVWVTLL